MRPEEATQTVGGHSVRIAWTDGGPEKKFVHGAWHSEFLGWRVGAWRNDGKHLGPDSEEYQGELDLDLTDWRDEIPWNVLADWVQVVVREPSGRWLACEYEPLPKNIHGWVGGGYVLFIDAIKMPEGPADWREAIAKRPENK